MPSLLKFSSPATQLLLASTGIPSRIVPRSQFWLVIAILGMGLALPAKADIPVGERAVLQAIYASTGGANWTGNAGWNGPPGTECLDWQGVECDAAHNHVTKVRIHSNNLVGSLPSITGLTDLEEFQVQNNHLTGRIPQLAGMTKLRLVVLNDNQFSGPIPALGGLSQLISFVAFSNQLTGSIPPLTDLSSMMVFNVRSNQLFGSLPSLAGLTSLRSIVLYSNQLSGDLPDVPHPNALGNGSSLLCLHNDGNGFSPSPNAGWDYATGIAPWYLMCDSTPDPISANGFD